MKNLFKIILSYLLISFNIYVYSDENKSQNILKIGVLAPLSGEFKSIGESVLYSINLATHDINDASIKIYPKDTGSSKKKLIEACKEFKNQGIKIVIGPIDSEFIDELKKFDDMVFLSLSNMDYNINKNVIMMGYLHQKLLKLFFLFV